MPPENLIFVGFELTDRVKDLLAGCFERDRLYLEDPAHLETIVIDGSEYVGKRAPSGTAVDRLEDTARSVVSLLSRVAHGFDKTAEDALVIAAEQPGAPAPTEGEGEPEDQADDFDYRGLVD